jgi:hypothetical protein
VVLLLAGCGGSSAEHKAVKRLTIPAYAGFPSTTITVTAGTREYCRRDARAFARDAVRFFRPFPSDADEYRLQARIQFIDFKAHLCDVAILRKALSRRLTLKRRRVIVRRFSWLGKTGPELTKEP